MFTSWAKSQSLFTIYSNFTGYSIIAADRFVIVIIIYIFAQNKHVVRIKNSTLGFVGHD